MSKKLKFSIIGLLGLTFIATSCSPYEIQVFKSLTSQQQESVLNSLRHNQSIAQMKYSGGQSKDCYTAISKHWPSALHSWARSIVWRESRNTPTAANPTSSARGCFQMLLRYSSPYYARVGCSNYMWANADCNAKAAYEMYKVAGTSPWRLY